MKLNFSALLLGALFSAAASARTPMLGEVVLFGGNFAPRGWAFCEGQLLSIAQNTALFSILGTTYGGDGRTTFGLPDLRGRTPFHPGRGPGLNSYRLGQKTGTETVTLTTNQLPSHTHAASVQSTLGGTSGAVDSDSPSASLPAPSSVDRFSTDTSSDLKMHESSTGPAVIESNPGGQSIDVLSPSTVVRYIIATQGTFPSRS